MSLFNRPAWAKSQTTEVEEADTNIFSHSSRSFNQIVAERERKKQQKAQKKKEREHRRSSGKREIKEEGFAESSRAKRRRISNEEQEEDESAVTAPFRRSEDGSRTLDVDTAKSVPIRRSPRKNKYADVMKHSFLTQPIIDLDDDDGTDDVVPIQPPVVDDVDEEESDPEFADLARRAREQRNRQNKTSQTPEVSGFSRDPHDIDFDSGQHGLPTALTDPTISLFITSEIPNTKGLIIHRKLSQRLQEPLAAWCMKQGFSQEFTQQVFLVHRMRKVYPVTTCKSLGLKVDPLGNLTLKGAEGKEDLEKVHLEAVTDEIYAQRKEQKAREAKQRSGQLPEEEPDETPTETGAENETAGQPVHIPIILRAKGRKEEKFHVKPVCGPDCQPLLLC